MDWTSIVLTVLAVAGTLLGTWLSQWQQREADQERHERQVRRQAWEAKRDAYVELVQAYERVESAYRGAVMSGVVGSVAISSDVLGRCVEAQALAELYASPEAWLRMEPALKAVAAKANYVAGGGSDAVELVRELGADTEEGAEALRNELLAAVRDDLGLADSS